MPVYKMSRYAIALTAALGLFMAVLDNTVVNVALTPMSTSLTASLSSIQWVVTGYFLAQAAVIPIAGYFSNRVRYQAPIHDLPGPLYHRVRCSAAWRRTRRC